MELIVTEKNNAARRIADILSEGGASTTQTAGVNVYEWGGRRCIGLSGHVVGVDFPPEYNDWRDVEPAELIHADVVKDPTQEDIVNALQRLAREADDVVIATDYDREGELIGKEAYELVREVNEQAPVNRVRFSSITDTEVRSAFADPDDIDFDLAAAGEARQIVDLMWGASLTRFLSLSAGQMGEDFISVGRVQSPTLKLIVDKEREIEAFDPDDYWELFADLRKDQTTFEAQYFYEDPADGTEAERVWNEGDADAAFDALRQAGEAVVDSVSRRTRTDDPPAPFNTTQFIRAAGSLGYSAGRAMSIAEDLYTAGYITYPRTDNTVYPDDLDERDLLEAFQQTVFGDDADSLLDQDRLSPTSGDEETTDHPPIHPTTDFPDRNQLSEDEWAVYELVVRRFFATVAAPAEWAHLRVTADADGESLKANGKRLVESGYHAVYPYYDSSENHVPPVEEGDTLAITDARLDAKQTQPPRRYGQSRLIETMESMDIGTKSTRHNTIEKLYDRGYIENDPPRPTTLAEAVVEAAEDYADVVVSEEMTSQLEADMTAIADGETTLDDVTTESREMLDRVFDELTASRAEIGDHLRTSLKADKSLGPCPECGDTLLLRQSRTGSHFVGCDGYPECQFTLPLPSTGDPLVMDAVCEDHDLHDVKMLAGRNTFVHGCPLCAAEAADESEDRLIGPCPDCGEPHGGELAIKQLQSGSRLVGCDRYPDCEYSLPLPRRGDIEVTETYCDEHDLPELVVHDGEDDDDPWELGCPICNYEEYQARQRQQGLEALDGVGPKTAAKLESAGVEDVGALADADPEGIADAVSGVSADTIREWQAQAD
ncbi:MULTISPECIES: DNA topoisomerase I [Halobacterium]|uniref:DNA topoisomerase I n=1 Tax=Halobacterium TaxID=2239 RepID=UPI0019638685|nr:MULTISPECIES: DNA topoisomerase I [Halobacterium]MDL0121466.1 DNA topoisomerase I [Halobacterium salinarum]MDL0133093.1 DNA topoisomerase I [Halobacterium salinarum]QRY25062.1 DNA topoisomerase I [Halobacterium sp. BOL4-2]